MKLDQTKKHHSEQVFELTSCPNDTLTGVQFDGCRFVSCDFTGFQFRECEFIDCEFVGCQLAGAMFGMSRFQEVVFLDCDVSGVDWTLADWSGFVLNAPFSFKNCHLNQGSFFGLELKSLKVIDCQLRGVDFREAQLEGADFENSDLVHAIFAHSDLRTANFVGTRGVQLDVNNNQLKGARFERVEAVNLLASLGIDLVD